MTSRLTTCVMVFTFSLFMSFDLMSESVAPYEEEPYCPAVVAPDPLTITAGGATIDFDFVMTNATCNINCQNCSQCKFWVWPILKAGNGAAAIVLNPNVIPPPLLGIPLGAPTFLTALDCNSPVLGMTFLTMEIGTGATNTGVAMGSCLSCRL